MGRSAQGCKTPTKNGRGMTTRLFLLLRVTVFAALYAMPLDAQAQQPSPVPSASCDRPYQSATVVKPVTPEYLASARGLDLRPVTVVMEVTVDASGKATRAVIRRSSGNADIDDSALRAARASTYASKVFDCVPVEGTYIFRAQFNPW